MSDAAATARTMSFFTGADAVPLDKDGMMSMPDIVPEVYQNVDLSPLMSGQEVDVLFKGSGESGFSLVRARFGPGFTLPRHSHSADCLYYVVAGEAHLGNSRVLRQGDGFFVAAGTQYTYTAGPEGVEVLEFRMATSFDMKVFDKTVERWVPILAAATGAARDGRLVTAAGAS